MTRAALGGVLRWRRCGAVLIRRSGSRRRRGRRVRRGRARSGLWSSVRGRWRTVWERQSKGVAAGDSKVPRRSRRGVRVGGSLKLAALPLHSEAWWAMLCSILQGLYGGAGSEGCSAL